MKLTDLIVSPKSLGGKLWLVDVSPAYEYQNNRRTDSPVKGRKFFFIQTDGNVCFYVAIHLIESV